MPTCERANCGSRFLVKKIPAAFSFSTTLLKNTRLFYCRTTPVTRPSTLGARYFHLDLERVPNDGARSVTGPDFSRRCHRDVRECRRGSRVAPPTEARLHSRARVRRRGQIPALSCAANILYTYYKPSGLGRSPRPGRLFFSYDCSVAKNP